MNPPDKCPKCGARIMSTDVGFVRFACMSYASTDEPVRESDTCLAFQRTQLAARVKELEPYEAICKNPAALWANWLRGTVVLPAGIGDVRQEQARVKELEAKLEAWKAYAKRLEEAGNMMAAVLGLKAGFYCVEKWTQAKESKP